MLEKHDRTPVAPLDDLHFVGAEIPDGPALRIRHLDVEACELDPGREGRRRLLLRRYRRKPARDREDGEQKRPAGEVAHRCPHPAL